MEHVYSSKEAAAVNLFVIFIILLSSASLIISTLDALEDWSGWFVIDVICVTVFAIEYVFKVLSCGSPLRWHFRPQNFIDFVALVSFILDMALTSSGVGFLLIIRTVRLVRLLQVFRLNHFSMYLQVISLTMQRSHRGLVSLAFFVFLATIVFSSVFYFFDRGSRNKNGDYIRDDGEAAPYDSIPESMWPTIQTLSSVGYGDISPVSEAGKFVMSIASILGILVIALPISIISNEFSNAYDEVISEASTVASLKEEVASHRKDIMGLFRRVNRLIAKSSDGKRASSHPILQRMVKDQLDGLYTYLEQLQQNDMIRARDALIASLEDNE